MFLSTTSYMIVICMLCKTQTYFFPNNKTAGHMCLCVYIYIYIYMYIQSTLS